MIKRIFYTLGYYVFVGLLYALVIVPRLKIFGIDFWDQLESFVRLNIPYFFLAILLFFLPTILFIIPLDSHDDHHS